MIAVKKTYANGHERTLTIISIEKTPQEDSAVVQTVESGAVVISRMDWPEVWAQFDKRPEFAAAKAMADARLAEINAEKLQGL